MKIKLISGLMALQLAAAMTVSSQTYTFTIGDPESYVRIADHIGGEFLGGLYDENTLEAYNLDIGNKKLVGLLRFNGGTGGLVFATHYWLPNTSDYLRALKGYQIGSKGAYVVAEKVSNNGVVKSAVLLHYDKDNGQLTSAAELASLPPGYSFIRIFDVMENFAVAKPKRILCTVSYEGIPLIVELLYDGTSQYSIRQYKMANPPKEYKSVHYVRAYHYGSVSIGEPAFYGLTEDGGTTSAFCYYENSTTSTQIYERYSLTSIKGIKGVSGVQMNGSYGPNGNHYRIEMAFTDEEGGICIQQKDELTTTNWQRYYQFPKEEEYRLGWGRDGHGTKMGPGLGFTNSLGYFLGAWMPEKTPSKSLVTALLFDGTNGDLAKPRMYDISGLGIFEDGSFPSTCYDQGYYQSGYGYVDNYTFIADRFEQRNGLRFGTGNTLDNNQPTFFCAKQHDILETREKRLSANNEEVYISLSEPYNQDEIVPEEYLDINVEIALDCPAEENISGKNSGSRLIQNESQLSMDGQRIHIGATNKDIASVHIFSIDGRSIAEVQGVNAASYEHQFAKPLVPGIYVVHIVYNDHSKEVRKVSIR